MSAAKAKRGVVRQGAAKAERGKARAHAMRPNEILGMRRGRLEMTAKKQRCAKCKQALVYYSMVLFAGPNGFRRYALCDKCKAEVYVRKRTEKAGSQAGARNLEREDAR